MSLEASQTLKSLVCVCGGGGGTELIFSIIVCTYRNIFNKNNSYQKLLNWFENESCIIYLSVLSKQLKLLN